MKKLVTVSLIILALIISLASCGDTSPDHVHQFSDWVTAKEPTTTAEGLSVRVCECGASETKPLAKITASEGLAFTSNGDGTCSVKGIGSCTSKDIFVPSTSPSGDTVTAIDFLAFKECSTITNVTLPDSVTVINSAAFSDCTSLKSITLGKGIQSIENVAFTGCTSLESIDMPEGLLSIGDFAFSNCENLTDVRLPDSLGEIGDRIFFMCDKIKLNAYDNAFYIGNQENPHLLLMKAKNKDIESCKINDKTKFIYDSAFYQCSELSEITIPEGVLDINANAFIYCDSLTSIDIPASVTHIAEAAITYCTNLKSINVHTDNASYKAIDGTLYTQDGKTLLLYAAGNTAKSLTVPETVTEIAENAFYGAHHLETVIFPESLEVIGDSAFGLCYDLDDVVIPDSVTNIGALAFSYCTSLKTVTIGIGVKLIDSYTFSSCESLTDVYYTGSADEWFEIEIENDNEYLTNATIHYDHKVSNP